MVKNSYIRTEEYKIRVSQILKEKWLNDFNLYLSRLGKNNPNWKGDQVTYGALHDYIKFYKKKPESCNNCLKKTTKLDLANISGSYKRDLDDYEWLCRLCHMKKDGRLKNLRPNSIGLRNPLTGRYVRREN